MIEIRIWQDRDGNWCGTGTFTDPAQEFVQYQPTKQITVTLRNELTNVDGRSLGPNQFAGMIVECCYCSGYKPQ